MQEETTTDCAPNGWPPAQCGEETWDEGPDLDDPWFDRFRPLSSLPPSTPSES